MSDRMYGRILKVGKKGIRALGVAESFQKQVGGMAVLAGVVQRVDGIVDGLVFGSCTVGGMDATDGILRMWLRLDRDDVNVIMLSGCVISWFNVVDLTRIHEETSTPLICLTYRESHGLTEVFLRRFPEDWELRNRVYLSNGERVPITLKTGFTVYVRHLGIDLDACKDLINRYLMHGRYPEPIRIARMAARSALHFLRLPAYFRR